MKKFYLSLAMLACFAASLAFVHMASAAAITLSATVNTTGAQPSVVLQWTDLGRDTRYDVYRDYQKECSQTTNTLTDTPTGTGQTHDYCIYATGGRGQAMVVSNHVTVNFSSGVVSAPTGLSAEPMWVASCPLCNGMAMAHIVLTWTPVSSATAYNVFRNGTLLQSNLSTPTDTDMTVVSGQQYTYAVSAVTPSGVTPQSAPATATAPDPPMPAAFTAPTNLAVNSAWAGGPVDTLTWDPVPGATSYNVYQYDKPIAKGVVGTSYTVPIAVYNPSMTYTVTAVDEDCSCESIPSNIAGAGSLVDPSNIPSWDTSATPSAPTALTATPEWNGSAPRIHLAWEADGTAQVYNVYRDGREVATGLWGLSWFDNSVQPGETHTYAITGLDTYWPGSVESPLSIPVTATALVSAPATYNGKVQITSIVPDDDSALVSFAAVPGAVDYCAYDVTNPGMVKYSGGSLSIQWNGITPATGADLVVEAVDKLGPFQTSDGMMGPGSTTMSGAMDVSINGQGDPSNLPVVLAKSDQFHVACQSQALTGPQAFYDDFTDDKPFTPSALDPVLAAMSNNYGEISQVENDKWRIRTYGADTDMSTAFVMNNHFMDTLYDGPTASRRIGSHNNNASLVIMPKATADITGGKVLHVTFEVDAHMDARRWVDCFVIPAGDTLLSSIPTKLENNEYPTTSGNMFFWQIVPDGQSPFEVLQGFQQSLINMTWGPDPILGPSQIFSRAARNGYGGPSTNYNGSAQDLDKRHKFDLYLSQTHFRLMECGNVVADYDLVTPLPFSQCQVCFVHELYHTYNDRGEQLANGSANSYYYNYRPWADERHWDNMGFEVLNGFPS